MDCSAEEAEIRRALEPVSGIASLGFQLGARRLTISAPADVLPTALEAIRRAGFKPEPVEPTAATSTASPSDGHEHGMGSGMARLGLALLVALAAEGIEFVLPDTRANQGLGMVLAVVAIWLAGVETYTKGFAALRRLKLNINALMTVAVTGAFLIGQWPEAAMVMALYAIAELIEARSVDRARNAIKGLMDLAPEEATVQQPGGAWTTVPVASVAIDSIVRIRPGDRVPLDGTVTRGDSAINQAPVTGESIPVEKAVGDPVFAGTINETGELEVRVTAAASNSTLARIIHAVEQAQGSRAPTQRFVDRFAAVYTPAVFALAVAVAVLLPLLTDATWLQGIYKALVLLVIACPCALVISTPVTVVSALAAAARRGILIKGGTYLEDARNLKAVALDKTGTITEGKPKLVDQKTMRDDAAAVLRLAASLAGRSDHPVSKAIAEGLNLEHDAVDQFSALAGRGVQGSIGGKTYVLGNHRLIEERGQCNSELENELKRHEQHGRTVTLMADEQGVIALFAVADTIKPSSKAAVADLISLGVTPIMLTGDNEATAQSIASQAGIEEARGNLLPEDKLKAIEELQKRFGLTGMTGDGINDAPALAKADIGIAMGAAGTDTAMEAADIVIMNDDLQRIPTVIRLSRKTHAVLWQNISFALGVKAVFFVMAVFGTATMWMAVFADMGASLLVVANGLRLLKAKVEPPHAD
ncbi:4-deoxy-4-formamido-L-arabinose-phospho-UDP deformylase [Pelomonas sp. Root662]|nr:4-deoxy-4-formamido-L-arabinose-phospho-UDP deformylase [Pelomonas sp. Root405]KRA77409.1 4-deoxy-4-formamido-L-arabinose-phospho-UDP deformylase [Pelomonas sp. Root662]